MTMLDDDQTTEFDAVTPEPAAGSDLRSRLRAARTNLLGDHVETFDVPGYPADAQIVIACSPIDGGQIEAVSTHALKDKSGRRGLIASLDTLAKSCVGVYVRDPSDPRAPRDPDDPLVGLVSIAALYGLGNPELPVRFGDPRLAEALEFDNSAGATGAVRETFGRNDAAILSVNGRLSRWMQTLSRDTDALLLGE